VLADIQGAKVATVPLTDDWDLPRDFASRMNDAGARLVCLVCPHAPTGKLVDAQTLGRLAEELSGVLLVDEAYVDFVDPVLRHDTLNLARAFDNVLLLRTLSKGFSLAGLRLGYLLGAPSLIAPMLTKTRDSYNVDALAQVIACAAFADLAHAERTWERVRTERRRMSEALRARGWDVPQSQTNFVLATPPASRNVSARALHEGLKQRGILVRYFNAPRLDDKLRITVGDPAQNDRLLSALDLLVS
jgi:histidinol-phosphate aminotransferase